MYFLLSLSLEYLFLKYVLHIFIKVLLKSYFCYLLLDFWCRFFSLESLAHIITILLYMLFIIALSITSVLSMSITKQLMACLKRIQNKTS